MKLVLRVGSANFTQSLIAACLVRIVTKLRLLCLILINDSLFIVIDSHEGRPIACRREKNAGRRITVLGTFTVGVSWKVKQVDDIC